MAPNLRKRRAPEDSIDKSKDTKAVVKRPPPKKRRTNASKKTQKAIGPPGKIAELPLEMFFEIFKFLEPIELLNLARTNKFLRNTLMNPSLSRSIWQAALAKMRGLPPCPEFLTEPHYVDLLFGNHCHSCGKNEGHVLWEFRVRYCRECELEKTVLTYDETGYKRRTETQGIIVYYADVCPTRKGFTLVADRKEFSESGNLPEFFEGRKEFNKQIMQHSSRCSKWISNREYAMRQRLEKLKASRLNAIVKRLSDLGYHTDIAYLTPTRWPLAQLPRVSIPEALTDAGWDEIRPSVVEFMESRKAARLYWKQVGEFKERLRFMDEALSQLRPNGTSTEPFPHFVDLAVSGEIQNIVELPNDVTVNKHSFLGVLPNMILRWGKRMKEKLIEHCTANEPSCGKKQEHTADLLDLAKTIFRCDCGRVRFWPAVLSHVDKCPDEITNKHRFDLPPPQNVWAFRGTLPETVGTAYEAAVDGRYLPRQPWELQVHRLHLCGERALNVFKACDKDLDTATAAEMDELDARFVCGLCSRSGKTKAVMNWRTAIYHCATSHVRYEPSELPWSRLSAAECREAKRLEECYMPRHLEAQKGDHAWFCRLCPWHTEENPRLGGNMPNFRNEALRHVHTQHGRLAEALICPDPDKLPDMAPTVYLFSDKLSSRDLMPQEQQWLEEKRASFTTFPKVTRPTAVGGNVAETEEPAPRTRRKTRRR
ncbi:hypothetical protein AcV5_000143 [Taiwanofungus camphoratus]|nr:hypothetical protein AcV5_000143 [Antrodia cinnamomea]